ncbi:MAG: hypothetical protein LPK03_16070 [Pontibacter sp.]|nr:hypothetical protein [Pontibacter sp.]
MKHLKQFLTRLQTFELMLIYKKVAVGALGHKEVSSYDIRHETAYDEAAVFESELRLLSQMAALDLLSLNGQQLQLVLEQTASIEKRFRNFWVNFHSQSPDYGQAYPANYLRQLNLPDLFVVRNLQPIESNIEVREELVDDLAESVKLREAFLQQLSKNISTLLAVEEHSITIPHLSPLQVTPAPVNSLPRFVEGMAEEFFHILKGYFTPEDQQQLLPLLQENQPPAAPLVFHGNGNQLADAFKQLYEANLIVGCLKADLEEWISNHFAYVFRRQQRTLPPGYLAAIISSNARPCQSPILDVRKQPSGTYAVYPVLRTQKNYNNQ